MGNPGINLLAPAAALHGVETMGDGTSTCAPRSAGWLPLPRGRVRDGRRRPSPAPGDRADVAFRLPRNEWNGAVSAQMLLRAVRELPELTVRPAGAPAPVAPPEPGETIDPRGRGVQVATISRLAAGGEDVLVVVADRAPAAAHAARRARARSGSAAAPLVLAEHGELERAAEGFAEVVVLDPPSGPEQRAALERLADHARVHLVWGAAEIEFARSVVESRAPLRPALAAVWRARRAGVEPELPPETVARCLAVLAELGSTPTSRPRARSSSSARPPTGPRSSSSPRPRRSCVAWPSRRPSNSVRLAAGRPPNFHRRQVGRGGRAAAAGRVAAGGVGDAGDHQRDHGDRGQRQAEAPTARRRSWTPAAGRRSGRPGSTSPRQSPASP